MYCTQCGKKNKDNDNYCNYCGAPLEKIKSNKQNIIPIVIIVILLISIVGISGSIIGFAKNIYISDVSIADAGNIFKKDDENIDDSYITPSKLSKTSIELYNIYENANIHSKSDVDALIVSDSVSQKSNTNPKIQEVENRIIQNYKIKAVNFGEMDLNTAEGIEEVVKYIYDTYPRQREILTNISVGNIDGEDSLIAFFHAPSDFASSNDKSGYPLSYKALLGLNCKFFFNPEYLEMTMTRSSTFGHFPKNSNKYSAVIHEFGHFLSFCVALKEVGLKDISYVKDYATNEKVWQLALDRSSAKTTKKMLDEAYNNYKRKYNDGKSFDEFRASISGYAVAKNEKGGYIYDETIAEAFHDYYCNRENAAKASIEIVNVLNSKL